MSERCSPARVRCAAPENGRALDQLARRSDLKYVATGGSGGNTIEDEIRFKEPDGLSAKKRRGVYTKYLTRPPLLDTALLI